MLTPLEKYQNVIKIVNKRGHNMGIDVLDENFTIYRSKFLHAILILVSFTSVMCYNIKIHSGNFEQTVLCLVFLSFLMKAAVKLTNILGRRQKLLDLIDQAENFYDISVKFGATEQLSRNVRILECLSNFLYSYYIFAAIAALLFPFILKLLGFNLILPFGFQLPYFEPFTVFGYLMNYLYCIYAANSGRNLYTCDIIFILTLFPSFGVYEMLIQMLDDLDKFESEKKNEQERAKLLNEIFKIHQDLIKFEDDLENFHSVANCFQLGVIITQAVTSLFALFITKWTLGVAVICIDLLELLLYCSFGTLLEIMQEKLRDKIFDIKWIGKTSNELKNIQIMQQKTNKVTKITYVFGFLDLRTYVMVKFPFFHFNL